MDHSYKNGSIIWHPESSYIADDLIIGKNCKIGAMVHIDRDVVIGNNVHIQGMCYIPPLTRIGNNVELYPKVGFSNDRVPPSDKLEGVTVEDDVMICFNSDIIGGVTIGQGSIIGMKSLVLNDIPKNQVWFGHPATYRYSSHEYWEKKNGR